MFIAFVYIESSPKSDLFSRKRPDFHHTCARCALLPSNIKIPWYGLKGSYSWIVPPTRDNVASRQEYTWLTTICPRSSDLFCIVTSFYVVSYYIKWVTTSWAHSIQYITLVNPLTDGRFYRPATQSALRGSKTFFFVSKNSCPFLYNNSLYKNGHYFLNMQY